ncbi:natural resistance-associated macrophage protein-domain-containing protein [Kockovaella imperatae]|uniref:Natural resistance-associated macrophage protein-domain-containing protein n=1 Tax=Kockovaella imperatae TaxID=4999 RepID=A0A1Y1UEA7_9TREE|nr:natural resistance-associated macrophage protein-domain-containing protein [Kockovaella imperatae]ORX36391.1 natural resistance-associated macrophage protein-domain-containing protein [Kockovaella imperatae]
MPSTVKSQDVWTFFKRHAHFLGPGLVIACGFIDPGNWATDLQAGADYGYKLLFIVLLAGLIAVVLQLLCVRLGAVTSSSLPAQTRQLFLRWEAKWPRWKRWLRACLYFLYGCAELAIIATDLAELLGTAIALNLLFPKLPLYAGVLITASDTLLVLLFFKSDSGRQGMVFFEIVIVSLVLCVFASYLVLLHLVKPDWGQVFLGYVPSKTLFQPGALYTGVGIIGATVMPHALYLGTSLATVDRLGLLPIAPTRQTRWTYKLPSLFKRANTQTSTNERTEIELSDGLDGLAGPSRPSSSPRPDATQVGRSARDTEEAKDADFDMRMKEYERELKAFDRINWVDLHLCHFQIDTAASLMGFAMIINSAILIVAGAAFYYGNDRGGDSSLQGAHTLLVNYLGSASGIIFALALLCAGQSASITATLAGQVVSEGFLEWKTSPVVRRAVTRLIGVIPSVIVAAAIGNNGINAMLVASQVILSIILPTAILPLVYLCSRKDLMTVEGPEFEENISPTAVETPSCSDSNFDLPVEPSSSAGPSRNTALRQTLSPSGSASSIHSSSTIRRPAAGARQDSDCIIGSEVEGSESLERAVSDGTATVPRLDSVRRTKSYASPMWVTVLGYVMFAIIVLANMYVIVELILGNG